MAPDLGFFRIDSIFRGIIDNNFGEYWRLKLRPLINIPCKFPYFDYFCIVQFFPQVSLYIFAFLGEPTFKEGFSLTSFFFSLENNYNIDLDLGP